MSTEPHEDGVLLRAVEALRDDPEPTWPETSERVRQSVRRTTRRTRRLAATTDDLAGGSFGPGDRLGVGERVVIDAVRQAVAAVDGVVPDALHLVLDGDRVTGMSVDLVVGYGTPVGAAAEAVRAAVVAALDRTLGPLARRVDVAVVDVEVGDPGR